MLKSEGVRESSAMVDRILLCSAFVLGMCDCGQLGL